MCVCVYVCTCVCERECANVRDSVCVGAMIRGFFVEVEWWNISGSGGKVEM